MKITVQAMGLTPHAPLEDYLQKKELLQIDINN